MKSSKLLSLLVAGLLVSSLAVGSAAAVNSSAEELPDESEVGTEYEATFELTELFDEYEQWTLNGETELTNVTWTIRQYDQADNQIRQTSVDGQEFNEDINIEDGTSRIEVRVTGTTPEIGNLSYDPEERFAVANFTQVREGGTQQDIASHDAHHYTNESKEARNAIDDANAIVNESGDQESQETLQSAISAYEAGNFENAINLAERAEDEATQTQTRQSFLLYGAAAVVVLLLLGGGYYLYKSRQQGPSRLR
ncbi:MAG: TolA-binding protein [Natronomonas sp.]|jgi:TolA-binding protein